MSGGVPTGSPAAAFAKTQLAPGGTKISPGGAAPPVNPSLVAGQDFENLYKGLDPNLQKTISSHPLVAGGKLSPAAALNILHYDKKPGEDYSDVILRSFVHKPAIAEAAAAGPSVRSSSMMATGVASPKARLQGM